MNADAAITIMRTRGPQLIQPYPPELAVNQIYKLGVEALGWNNTTTAGKALIAEDMKLFKRLQLAHTFSYATDWPNQYTAIGRK